MRETKKGERKKRECLAPCDENRMKTRDDGRKSRKHRPRPPIPSFQWSGCDDDERANSTNTINASGKPKKEDSPSTPKRSKSTPRRDTITVHEIHEDCSSSAPDPAVQWYIYLQSDPGRLPDGWYEYDPHSNLTVEQLFQSSGQAVPNKLHINGYQYELDFQRRTQRNVTTGTERPIQRTTNGHPPPAYPWKTIQLIQAGGSPRSDTSNDETIAQALHTSQQERETSEQRSLALASKLQAEEQNRHSPKQKSDPKLTQQQSQATRVPFGDFDGSTIYRNRMAAAQDMQGGTERPEAGHFSIDELILPDCTAALCTAFSSSGLPWLYEMFGTIRQLTVVVPARRECPSPMPDPDVLIEKKGMDPDVKIKKKGIEAEIHKMKETNEDWHWVNVRLHTGGCFHSKVLLFRSDQGLRVVISGNNLTKRQWECHRDVFWVQDFPVAKGTQTMPPGYWKPQGSFGYKLHALLQEMTVCKKKRHHKKVTERLDGIFDTIDFVTKPAQAELVFSFPRQKEDEADRGGWKQLAHMVYQAMHRRGMAVDPDDSSDDEGFNILNRHTSRLYATSGSFGDLRPDFLLQMYEAMDGILPNFKVDKTTEWDDVDGLVKCFWPSVATACTMDLSSLCAGRYMPERHLDTIPEASRRRVLHDAIPNPKTKSPSWLDTTQNFHCITHGKFLFNFDDLNNRGVLYVGSHNFSKSAWGLRDAQPKNVEIGVVLASRKPQTLAQWRQRLPCELVGRIAKSPESYRPYSGWQSIKDHHPSAQAWRTYWKRVYTMQAAQKLRQQAEGVLRECDTWMIETPLEEQTLEQLKILIEEFGDLIEERAEEVIEID